MLAAGANDSTVWMWQRQSKAFVSPFRSTGRLAPLTVATSMLTMLLFPLNSIVPSGNNMQVFAGHTDAITAIAFTPDGQYESSIHLFGSSCRSDLSFLVPPDIQASDFSPPPPMHP